MPFVLMQSDNAVKRAVAETAYSGKQTLAFPSMLVLLLRQEYSTGSDF